MSDRFSIIHEVIRPDDAVQHVVDIAMVRYRATKGREFLENGADHLGRLACQSCRFQELCGAVAATVVNQYPGGIIPRADQNTLSAFGINVDPRTGDICPKTIVEGTVRRIETGMSWVERGDPMNAADTMVQAVDALRVATDDVMERIASGILL